MSIQNYSRESYGHYGNNNCTNIHCHCLSKKRLQCVSQYFTLIWMELRTPLRNKNSGKNIWLIMLTNVLIPAWGMYSNSLKEILTPKLFSLDGVPLFHYTNQHIFLKFFFFNFVCACNTHHIKSSYLCKSLFLEVHIYTDWKQICGPFDYIFCGNEHHIRLQCIYVLLARVFFQRTENSIIVNKT